MDLRQRGQPLGQRGCHRRRLRAVDGDLGGAEEAREVAQGVGQAAKQLVAGRHMHMLGVVTPSWLWDHLRVGRIVSARADCSMLSRLRRSAA